jgi:hypothetical protein
MIVAPGSTDVTIYVKLQDPTTGAPETGLTITDLDLTYVRDGTAASKADLTALAAVDSAHGDNKAIQVDATNAPGLYRVDVPDAAFAAGVARVQLVINGAAIDPAVVEVELPAWLTATTGATVKADVIAISGDTNSADNLEAATDGNAYNVGGGAVVAASVTGAVGSVSGNVGGIAGTLTTIDALWAKIQKWLRLALRKDAAIVTDHAAELAEINADLGSGAGAYASTTDSQEALRDQGDAAWITATGFATPGAEMDLIDAPNGTAVTAIQNGLATSDNQTTILDRLGAWTGTGVNNILGAFKALLSKAASAPSDIGGTFTPATDSTEAIRDTEPLGTAMRGTDGAYTGTPPTADAIGTDAAGKVLVTPANKLATNASGQVVASSVVALGTQAKADVNAEVVDALTVDIVADSIPADGTRPSIAQAAYMLGQFMLERAVVGTTVTVYKADGVTPLFTLTLNDATSPTTITRAS